MLFVVVKLALGSIVNITASVNVCAWWIPNGIFFLHFSGVLGFFVL